MIFDLPSAQKLAHSQDEFKRRLGLSHEEGIRFYRSQSSALYESVFSTLQFYSHKQTVVLHRGVSPFIQQLEGPLHRDSKKILPVILEASELEKETAVVVLSADHIVTGQKYATERIEEIAQQARIICIKLIHSKELIRSSLQKEIFPYSIELLTWGQGQILVRLGKKCKIHSFFSHLDPVIQFDLEADQGFQATSVNSGDVPKAARHRLLEKGWEFFPASKVGFGRSFISHSELNSEWVLQQLRVKCSQIDSDLCESTSLCRWQAGSSFYDWWEGRPSDSFLRGGLVLDSACFDVPGFVDALIELSVDPQFVL